MVDISRRDYLAATAVVAMGNRAVGAAEARPEPDTSPEPTPWRPDTLSAEVTSTWLRMRDLEWSEVPGISAEEAAEFTERLKEAADELDGGRNV